ncbi:MAG: hypothetical protein ACR2ML_04260 [Solirubrobacteraceae bacterium]
MARRIALILASAALGAGALSACGDDDKTGSEQLELTAKTGERVSAGAKTGALRLVDAAPMSYGELTGSAMMTRSESGTTLRVQVSGLEPGTRLAGHVHEKPCAQDEGGDHYQFLRGGAEEPPNEIHVKLVAGKGGAATATASTPQIAGLLALSLVVHDAIRGGKVACADLA